MQGWYELKEWLKPYSDEQGLISSRLVIFENCTNLIRTLPALLHDEKNPNDVSSHPHELTHAPDALRGFVCSQVVKYNRSGQISECSDEYGNFLSYGM